MAPRRIARRGPLHISLSKVALLYGHNAGLHADNATSRDDHVFFHLFFFFFPEVEEAVGLVRAAAEHEKIRQEHLKRMKALKAQLEILKGARG